MYSIQMDKTIQKILQLFYQIGIWQRDEESNYRKIAKKLFYTFFGALFPIFFATNIFLCVDRNESIFSTQAAIVAAIIYVKFLYLLFKKQEILTFLNDPIVVHSIENLDEFGQASKKIGKFMGFVRPYCLTIPITTVSLIIIKLPTFYADKSLPIFISFSWNDSAIIYWLAYFFVTLSQVLYCVVNFMTVLIWYIMFNYSVEYQLLGNKLKSLGVTTVTNQDKNEGQKKFMKIIRSQKTSSRESKKFVENLIVLVKAHRNLNEKIERFRSHFSTLFLGQITTTGVIICVAVYNLVIALQENIVQTEMHVTMLLYGMFDIFLVTYLAGDITVASDGLSYCLFESNWIEQTESCKKYVLIMGEALKQPQQLVVLIYPMNLDTFVKIINGAYSVFNILKQFQ